MKTLYNHLPDFSDFSPETLRVMAIQDMGLGEFFRLDEVLSGGESLRSFAESILRGIEQGHPEVAKLISFLGESDLFEGVSTEKVLHFIHHCFLLEQLTTRMIEDVTFMQDLFSYFQRKRADKGLFKFSDIYRKSGELFLPVKVSSIDFSVKSYIYMRSLDQLSWKGDYGGRYGVTVNIFEAMITEWWSGFKNNAKRAWGLIKNPPKSFRLTSDKRLKYGISPEWMQEYQLWNFIFILGNVANLHLVAPKLLIPCVAQAKSEDYLYYRVCALWLSINFHLLALNRGQNVVCKKLRDGIKNYDRGQA